MASSGNPCARRALRAPRAVCLTLLLICSALAVADGACNCDAIQLTPAPVCGSNGVTYANACVATCQGIAVAAPAACDSAAGPAAAAASPSGFSKSIVSTATVSRAVLNKHRAEGFSYVARVRLDTQAKARMPTAVHTEEGTSRNAAPRQRTVMRITNAGGGMADLYAFPVPASNASSTAGEPLAASVEPRPAGGQPSRGRRLQQDGNIVGEDNRIDADMLPHLMPLSAVGYVDFGCSGALVGPRTVLTAAHCIYSANTGTWKWPSGFVPNLHNGGYDHCHVGSHPRRCYAYRKVPVVKMVAMTLLRKCGAPGDDCISGKDIPFDIAVLILAEDLKPYGSFGFTYNCSAKAQKTFTVSTAGYPGDKEPGALFTSFHLTNQPTISLNMCPAAGKKAAVTSQLDTYQGQSGSSVWSADLKVRGVISAANSAKKITYLAPIDKEAAEFIKRFRK